MTQFETILCRVRWFRWFQAAISNALLISLSPACMSSNIDFEDVHVTRHNLVFSGVDSTNRDLVPQATSTTLEAAYEPPDGDEVVRLPSQTFSFAKLKTSLPKSVSTKLEVQDARLEADAETQDLSFLRRVKLTMLDTQENDPQARELFDHENKTQVGTTQQETIAIPMNKTVTVDPRQLHLLTFELSLWAALRELPNDDWTIAVTLNLDGTVNVNYP